MSSSSSPLISILSNVSQQITIYLGTFLIIIGVIGGILNIIIFLSLHTFRENSCAFYLLIMSFVNIGQLFSGQLSRTMISGYYIDWTLNSLFYCKFRWFFIQGFTIISFSCMCFATTDQYLSTSYNRRYQQWNSIKLACYLCIIAFICAIAHGIPSTIYYNHTISLTTNKTICTITNNIYQKYRTYVSFTVIAGALPVFISVLFGSLSYRNVQQLSYRQVPIIRRELDKQLTRMVLVQDVYIFIAIVPYTIVLITETFVNVQNNPLGNAQLQFAESLTATIYYTFFSFPFYIYIIVSKRFRQQLIYVLSRIYNHFGKQLPIVNNQIAPETTNIN
ncbi:unnamed protein product [Adineta steineri]|uniref:G-protein coupled receptors family 1 profile domain-containing protein n=1 Tax=Adineta steineri TaxID=433720 RepID=A0A814PFH9_9BILA|nr:unnamed protein product [Adineta steineri]CAF3926500.1 unnamed protein product [Adineta steineri]